VTETAERRRLGSAETRHIQPTNVSPSDGRSKNNSSTSRYTSCQIKQIAIIFIGHSWHSHGNTSAPSNAEHGSSKRSSQGDNEHRLHSKRAHHLKTPDSSRWIVLPGRARQTNMTGGDGGSSPNCTLHRFCSEGLKMSQSFPYAHSFVEKDAMVRRITIPQ
jgi:hypothetical protein